MYNLFNFSLRVIRATKRWRSVVERNFSMWMG